MGDSPFIGVGRVLFRFRSFTPVPVLIGLAYLLWRSRGVPGPGGEVVDLWLNVAGVAVAFLGQALRFYTLGQVPEGTSGQGSALEAKTLNTRGPYAYVRNPLYVGNLGIVLGLCLVANSPLAYAAALGFFFGEYFFIIRAEESFLRARFGPVFDEYTSRVRRWVPRLTPAYPGTLRAGFDWKRALKKEHNPFAYWASGMLLLFAWEKWERGEWTVTLAGALGAAQLAVLCLFVLTKAYKRGLLFRDG